MAVYKRGGRWWYEFQWLGSRIRESAHTNLKSVAIRLERERRRQLELGTQGLVRVAQPKRFDVVAQLYLIERQAHWSMKTREMHANSLRHLGPHFGRSLLNEIQPEDVSRYQRNRLKKGVSGRTVNIEIALLRLVLRKAKLWHNLEDEVRMLKERKDIGRDLSADETHRLLSACKASTSRGLYPAVLTSIHTGLRSAELRTLRWRQVDLIDGTIQVGKSKTEGGEGRLVYLSDMAKSVLQTWRSEFPDSPSNPCCLSARVLWPPRQEGHVWRSR